MELNESIMASAVVESLYDALLFPTYEREIS